MWLLGKSKSYHNYEKAGFCGCVCVVFYEQCLYELDLVHTATYYDV